MDTPQPDSPSEDGSATSNSASGNVLTSTRDEAPRKSARARYVPNSQPLPLLSRGPSTSSPSYGRETITGRTMDESGNQFYILKVGSGSRSNVEQTVPVELILKHVSQAQLEEFEYTLSKKVKAGEQLDGTRFPLGPDGRSAIDFSFLDVGTDVPVALSRRRKATDASRSQTPGSAAGRKRKGRKPLPLKAKKPREARQESSDDDEEVGEWEVENVVGDRISAGSRVYEVKWVGYEDTTWEPAEMMEHAGELVSEYWSNKRNTLG